MLFGLAKLAMGVGTVALVAFALFVFDVTSLGFAVIPMVVLLLVIGWAVGLIVIGLILRVGQGAEILAWGFIVLSARLGIFYPVSALPGVLNCSPRRCRPPTSSPPLVPSWRAIPSRGRARVGCRGHGRPGRARGGVPREDARRVPPPRAYISRHV